MSGIECGQNWVEEHSWKVFKLNEVRLFHSSDEVQMEMNNSRLWVT